MKSSASVSQRNNAARQAELDGDTEKATSLYEQNIKEEVADQFAYDRLMVIYRKGKLYKEELRVIKRGIEVFKEQGKKLLTGNIATHKNKSQLIKLSNAFMKGSGLVDKKGNDKYIPEPVNKWMKRQEVVEKKLKPKKK